MTAAWRTYQEEAAEFFRSLGGEAATDIKLQGARTDHDVDVFVRLDVAGFEVRWIVECKLWKTPVNKLHVLGLRQIVSDLGVDRGVILCETGFQSGAVEAAALTNIQIASLAELGVTSRHAVYAARLRDLYDRVEAARVRYWDIPKGVRVTHGLRPEPGFGHGYLATSVVDTSLNFITRALRGVYPILVDPLERFSFPSLPEQFRDHEEIVTTLEPLILELEDRLAAVPWPC